jgi:hypothetical protein
MTASDDLSVSRSDAGKTQFVDWYPLVLADVKRISNTFPLRYYVLEFRKRI